MARSKKIRWNRTLRWLVLGIMLANLFLAGITPATAQEPSPFFSVRPEDDQVEGWEWQAGTEVSLSINGGDPYTQTPDGEGNVGFGLQGIVDIQVGDVVTLSDGTSTKSHIVTSLAVTVVDAVADTVSGTADASTQVQVWICDEGGCANREETADGSGYWMADFANPGSQDWEQDTWDIQPGMGGDAAQWDVDGDSTLVGWHVPNPRFEVRPEEDQIDGWEWEADTEVSLSINGGAPYTQTPDGEGYVSFGLQGIVDIQVGDFVTLSDLDTTKEHTVVSLAVTGVDPENDIISGMADAGSEITVWTHEGGGGLQVTADADGNWSADLSTQVDLTPGSGGGAAIYDGDQDSTAVYWWIPNLPFPHFQVRTEDDQIDGWEWPTDAEVTLSIDDPSNGPGEDYTDTQTADGGGNVSFNLQGIFGIEVGDLITLSDGVSTKEHVVANITVTGMDPTEDTIWGTADADSEITVWTHDGGANLQVTANGDGDWLADLTDQVDLGPGWGGGAALYDVDQDSTADHWWIPNPSFSARPEEDRVGGWEWQPNSSVTVSVGSFSSNANTDEGGNFDLYLDGFDLQPGHYVTVSDGSSTKYHTVTGLTITGIDPDLDTVSGTAAADSQVQVWICDDQGCANRHVVAEYGTWVADFANAGTGEDEQDIVDIGPGTGGDTAQWDDDGDGTQVGWQVPNPTFAAHPDQDRVDGWEWPLGETVTLEIDDPDNGPGIDYSATQTVGVAEWDPNQTYVQFDFQDLFDLGPGYVVTLNTGTTTKTHIVTNLAISEVNADANTVSGTADPETNVDIWSCDDQGCANRHVVVDGGSFWTADFANPGPGDDEQDTLDIVNGTGGDVSQSDDDGDSTQLRWEEAHPRMEVSYEHDWIQIRGFTPDGEVTYTIFDYEGGHALFGPVTGPVDSHGDGWISNNLHHVDLIPGIYVVAVNEASGDEVSLLIQDLNLDYLGVEDDRAFGTAEPNSTIELNISESHDHGFNLMVDVGSDGYWEVDLAAEGYPIDSYRHAHVNLYDGEGDNITAQAPRIQAQVSTDNFGVDNFSKNADVTLTLYDAPSGDVLYGPETLRTDSSGNAWVNLWEYGIDLLDWHYIVAYDHTLDFAKDLWIEPFTFEEMNTADDYVRGTSLVDEWVELHVESLFSNWGMNALTDGTENWYRDYGSEGYDITEQMWAYGWAIDDQGNWSQDHITGLPNIEASPTDDWISGFNFTPDRPVWIGIYESDGGELLADMETTANGNTQFQAESWEHGVDLQPGMYLHAVDTETGKSSSLTLEYLTFDRVDYDAETAYGQAYAGTQVVVRADLLFEHYEVLATADEDGNWYANFSHDLTLDWSLRAMVFDDELDATVADAPRQPEFAAAFDQDWGSGNNWSPNDDVQIEVFADANATDPLHTILWGTDEYGNFHADLWNQDVDLQPGQYVRVTDLATSQSKATTLVNLTIESVDPENDLVEGFAPGDTRISVNCWNDSFHDGFDLFSGPDGTWQADFGAHFIDLTPDTSCDARIYDEDNDATQANWHVSNPTFAAQPVDDAVQGWQWPLDAMVTVSVDQDGDPNTGPECERTTAVTPAPWDPHTSWFRVDFQGECDLADGDTVTVSDDQTTKTHVVTGLEVQGAEAESDTVFGAAESDSEVRVWLHEEWNSDLELTVDENGRWTADYAGMFDLQPGTAGAAVQEDEDGDQTWIDWEVPSPPFYCEPGSSISGKVTEADGETLLDMATVHIEDFHTGEELYYVEADEFGLYNCALPDGDYRVWADGSGTDGTWYSREYYQETIFEHALMLQVGAGVTHDDVDLTLDTPVVIYDHFTFNLTDPVIADLAVRQAIAYGTDRARIIAETFPSSPMMHSYLNPDHWAADYGQMTQYDFDPGLAAEILTQAGWFEGSDGVREKDGQRLHIVYVTTELPPEHFRHTISEIFIENMEYLGVEVEVIMTSEVWDRVFQRHDFGIAQFAWGTDVNDDTWPGMIFASDHDLNGGLYSRQEVDELLKQALDYGTRAEKRPYLLGAQQFVMEDLATLPLLMRWAGNQPPAIDSITAPVDPVTIADQPVSVEVAFSDPDANDVHTVTWNWGDESSDTQAGVTSPASAEHTYAEPGVYRVEVTVDDGAGGSDTKMYEFIVVYDPEGGFVTGGGWIWSPAGAYAADPALEGKANFGFVSKYKKGAKVPSGQTQFQFKAGDLNFHSVSYDWLVVAGAKAKFKGVGTINGAGNYGFMLTAIDGALTPSTYVDLFRIKIWDRDNGDVVVYDNLMDADDDADPTTAIGGGNIVVHKAK